MPISTQIIGAITGTSAEPAYLLLDDGTYLLLDDGEKIIL